MAGPAETSKEKKSPLKKVDENEEGKEDLKVEEKVAISFTQKEHTILKDMFGDYRVNPAVGKDNPKLLIEVLRLEERLVTFIRTHDPAALKLEEAQKAANEVLSS